MEGAHGVVPHVGDLEHLAQLLHVARDEVQEGQALEVLGLLVAELHYVVVALPQRLDAQARPGVLVIQFLDNTLQWRCQDCHVAPGPGLIKMGNSLLAWRVCGCSDDT